MVVFAVPQSPVVVIGAALMASDNTRGPWPGRQRPLLVVGTVRRVMVFKLGLEAITSTFGHASGPSWVHLSATGARASASHVHPVILAI